MNYIKNRVALCLSVALVLPALSSEITRAAEIVCQWNYLTPSNTAPTYFGDNVSGWVYSPSTEIRPLGSMYCDEVTPDNYRVDSSGAWIK